jgi:hypothetical protein
MKKTYSREFRHPKTFEGAELVCNIRGENNYVVACYRGSQQDKHSPSPCWLQRGGKEFARMAWKGFQERLLAEGFERK